jgi:hypothetical protein
MRRYLWILSLAIAWQPAGAAERSGPLGVAELDRMGPDAWRPVEVDLAPARWIWLPSQRTLPNTFVLFRREIALETAPRQAKAWITADSRYRLSVNGRRVQWGPAPCDPRQWDVDPVDLSAYLHPGRNVIGVEVLFYGLGDGTWPAGKPGLLFHATLEQGDGRRQTVVSDGSWLARVDRAHAPGRPKRWFLRALQEEFDARLHPDGWDTPQARLDDGWVAAQVLDCGASKPASSSGYEMNDLIERADPDRCALRKRQIPALRETLVPALRLAESGRVDWLRDPADWFEFRMPNSYRAVRAPLAQARPEGGWLLPAAAAASGETAPGNRQGRFVTFEFPEQMVGWPYFTIDAPAGTVVEVMTQESHSPRGPAWLDTHFFAWTRFICREGTNRFETFDYESLRWLQLHVRNAARQVAIRDVGLRRRQFAWRNEPRVRCSEPALQRLFDAAVNTLRNSAQEVCADGMGRERQQYSGDGGHQLHAIRYVFGDTLLPARFLRTFSEGQTPEGYFLDCWPAYDRLARVMQKQVDGAYWGPLLDHGVGFVFDCWHHWMYSGDLESLREPYPRLLRFAQYLASLRDPEGLLPVEHLGVPTVWIDHDAYRRPRHKQCAFNLYAAAMLERALSPLARAFGDRPRAEELSKLGQEIRQAAVRRFWSPERGLFVNNRPWLAEEHGPRLCDRSLATAILFDQCPHGDTRAAVCALAECPPEMGLSYPCNANWRYWALAKAGRAEQIIGDFRRRWATMRSVLENNTIQESWEAQPDSTSEWSHCALSPLFVLMMDIAGVRPTAPGFARYRVRPQLADLGRLDLVAYAPTGQFEFTSQPVPGGHRVALAVPARGEGELLLPPGSESDLAPLPPDHALGLLRFRLRAGQLNRFLLKSPASR